MEQVISGQLVDIEARRIYSAKITIVQSKIVDIEETTETVAEGFILPGFIDAHIHIESSMLTPFEFGEIALKHGTLATVSDPHEIANVLGIDGINFLLKNASYSPLQFVFGAPSCVPATSFETAGAILDDKDINFLFDHLNLSYLSEMMNYPGAIHGDEQVLLKIEAALSRNLPVDGHAPGLRGKDLNGYISRGISTDHEAYTYEEAKEKIEKGMKIIIREGSAAKNYEALKPLIDEYAHMLMFCSDDKHPDDLLVGHINKLVVRAIQDGFDLFDVLQIACLNPVHHYNIPLGTLRVGDMADFIRVEDVQNFEVLETWKEGVLVFDHTINISRAKPEVFMQNNFRALSISLQDLACPSDSFEHIQVIQAHDGELITSKFSAPPLKKKGYLLADKDRDLLKIVVLDRYSIDAKPAVGFIHGFGLKKGAIASSVAHDCHNIIAVGVDDTSIHRVIDELISCKGGIFAFDGENTQILPLPIGGIISPEPAVKVGSQYARLDSMAKLMGSRLRAPFMTLSFMALLVIPSLKMSDKGLFDGNEFRFVPLQRALDKE